MTNLEALIELAERTCPRFTVDWGFEADIDAFLASSLTKNARVIFIGVGAHIPEEANDDGTVDTWKENFTITLRAPSIGRDDLSLYTEFIALRDALPGYRIPNSDRYVEALAGTPGVTRGSHEATLSILI